MLNGDRIRLMTEMAIYEKREGRTDEQVDAYFKSDYLSAELLKSFLAATIVFLMLIGVYCLYHFEELMLTIYSLDLKLLIRQILTRYFLFLAVFLVITLIVYVRRYNHTRRNLREYYRNLKELSAGYERNEDM
ncbi:MAG: hypothetical protein IJI62_02535 [Lachnospiraceae bacterium]|jgi:hypothetical protein|nr:hypothetical protein [Lachnospiraceae bacterium]MBQ6362861.1 hypothetical protein [Lachnospiraceae bacterium]